MYIPFSEEFEHEFESKVYYVVSVGFREIDDEGRVYTELTKLEVTDEHNEPVEETSDAYLEIQEYVLHDRDYEVEEHGFVSEWDDEEEIPYYLRSS